MTSRLMPALAIVAAFVSGCGSPSERDAADTIYAGGDIITMNSAQPVVEALAVKSGKILAVGTRREIEKSYKGRTTTVVDLGGKALLPGFIDPHSHFIDALSMADRANVSAPPVGPASNPDEIVATLQSVAKSRQLKPGELLLGYEATFLT